MTREKWGNCVKRGFVKRETLGARCRGGAYNRRSVKAFWRDRAAARALLNASTCPRRAYLSVPSVFSVAERKRSWATEGTEITETGANLRIHKDSPSASLRAAWRREAGLSSGRSYPRSSSNLQICSREGSWFFNSFGRCSSTVRSLTSARSRPYSDPVISRTTGASFSETPSPAFGRNQERLSLGRVPAERGAIRPAV